jgi:CSLREA domain-containing protein
MNITSRTFLLLTLAGFVPAGAAVITVGTLVDADVAEGLCSLREAIVAANGDAAYRECPAGSGADRIEFDVTGTILLAADLPTITASLELLGPAATVSGFAVTIDGADQFRPILATNGGANGLEVKLSRLAILRGHASDAGGCISIPDGADLVDLRRVRFEGCSSDDDGGAIDAFAASQMTIRDATFVGNTAGAAGGAVNCWNFGALTVEDSTFVGNDAGVLSTSGSAGAIAVSFVDLVLRRSTISANGAGGNGGGLAIGGLSTSRIESSTLFGNSAGVSTTTGAGGGISLSSGSETTLVNSVVAGNVDLSPPGVSATDIYLSGGGSPPLVHTEGFNFIGDHQSVEVAFPLSAAPGQPNAFGDFVGDDAAPLDPLLGALTERGGPTWTHEPLPGSPLVDQGGCVGEAKDQRGFFRLETGLRVVDEPGVANFAAGCDIGAVELGATNSQGLLLRSNFEHGELAAWSSSVP